MRNVDRPEYQSWRGMRYRCERPKDINYAKYGGRGIRVCERWQSFSNFLADMGPRPPGASLDRINNDGDYEPSNCRWATASEQNINKPSVPKYEIDGEALSAAEWALRMGVPVRLISNRIWRGWDPREAILTPALPVGTRRTA
jgi:hypothetical protein